ncbi:hypothetical protein CONPUDRAFT_77826 [Coniophora puteana RWD-64-598 SS2]|uniref:Uncharacterized protein n=1 Tax=Coniophora puteana (strain RWD-64-598) TaxID=741705 RepID=R7SF64_CONPW|nr:uncharacterized protein CONPUDRAFT_77826 [Coniophora puteana RWD-64-598 SS2]EIW74520.1 hypothetical protein CONPUDRAFT_77826 [Coniophora puteana RWD-64-598 SS2]
MVKTFEQANVRVCEALLVKNEPMRVPLSRYELFLHGNAPGGGDTQDAVGVRATVVSSASEAGLELNGLQDALVSGAVLTELAGEREGRVIGCSVQLLPTGPSVGPMQRAWLDL